MKRFLAVLIFLAFLAGFIALFISIKFGDGTVAAYVIVPTLAFMFMIGRTDSWWFPVEKWQGVPARKGIVE
jgi:peptidoglycan/LPS O-acetylase OafA/YrhL